MTLLMTTRIFIPAALLFLSRSSSAFNWQFDRGHHAAWAMDCHFQGPPVQVVPTQPDGQKCATHCRANPQCRQFVFSFPNRSCILLNLDYNVDPVYSQHDTCGYLLSVTDPNCP